MEILNKLIDCAKNIAKSTFDIKTTQTKSVCMTFSEKDYTKLEEEIKNTQYSATIPITNSSIGDPYVIGVAAYNIRFTIFKEKDE